MVCTVNASTSSSAIVSTADGSGVLKVQSNGVTTNALAWVNFGYVASAITVRAQYNVSSITRVGTGAFQINFTTATTDANYSVFSMSNQVTLITNGRNASGVGTANTTSLCQVGIYTTASAGVDPYDCYVSVFGN
jgi:hypothetical protein